MYIYSNTFPGPRLYSGPGWLMSLAYIDPGNLEADLQMGACTFGKEQYAWIVWCMYRFIGHL